MQTLFGFEEPKTSLKISAAPKKQLSKAQTQFNSLITRIENLQKDIVLEQEKYDALLRSANQRILPAIEKIARARIEMAFALDKWAMKLEFKRKQLENAGECIVYLLELSAQYVEFGDAENELYTRWTDSTLEEAEAERANEEKQMLEDLFEMFYGVDIDIEELRNDPEKMEEFKKQMEGNSQTGSENYGGKRGRKPPKSSKASKKEELKKAEEELKSKSVRSIYISLAKLLHPDMETDPNLRGAKEEEMKKVTAAYEDNDLAALLKMEMEWIHKQNNQLDAIPDEKLMLFVAVLKDQVKELEAEKHSFKWDPRYQAVSEYGYGHKETGLRKIKKEADHLLEAVTEIEKITRSLDVANPKKRIMALIQELMDQMNPFGF